MREREITIFSYLVPPALTKTPPDSTTGTEGQRFELICEASGRPPPRIRWSKSITGIDELGDPSIRDLENGSLVFERLQMNQSGVYSCSIVDGQGSSSTQLRVVRMEEEFHIGKRLLY